MQKPDPLLEPLSAREVEILALLAANHSNAEISSALSLSLSTIKWYARQIYGKLGVENRRQAVAAARRLGLLAEEAAPVPAPPAAALPTGTVSFLFTDVEGSTPLWEQMPAEMQSTMAQHHALLRRAIEANAGQVFQIVGDEFQAAFRLAPQALYAALDIQRALQSAPWGATGPIRVRMGLHTGPIELDPKGDAPYAVSHTLNRAARVRSAAVGGQILLSQEAKDLVERSLPEGVTLLDLGEHHLKGMQWLEHLFQVCAAGLPSDFPLLATGMHTPNNLPVQLTSFIGRESQVAEVLERLGQHRMVTLTGSGGTGKTRLALQVAGAALQAFPAGAWFVDLVPVSNAGRLPHAVAAALGLQETIDLPVREILVNYLKSRRLLLVLDNCEHLIEACAGLVDNLLRACPSLTLLATSREALRVTGELSYRVPSLSVPDSLHLPPLESLPEFEAVRLFMERAVTSRPDFRLTAQNAPAVVQICRRLDGIPLAIELAAARVGVISVEQIDVRLDHAFRLLTGGARTTLPRQQTLRGSIDWSYNLLSEPERLLLKRLSVFVGGCTLEAAEAVCGLDGIEDYEVLDLLTSLVNKSLVNVFIEDIGELSNAITGRDTRYLMLETIRQYARERLVDEHAVNEAPPVARPAGGLEEIRARHLEYFARLAVRAGQGIVGREQAAWVKCLNDELDNIRAGLEWSFGGDPGGGPPRNIESGLGILNELYMFLYNFGHGKEALVPLKAGLAYLNRQARPPRRLLGLTYGTASVTYFSIGDLQNSLECAEQAVDFLRPDGLSADLAGWISFVAFVLNFLGSDWPRALALATESVDMARQAGDQYILGRSLLSKGLVLQQTDLQASRAALEECLSILERIGELMYSSNALRLLGLMAMMKRDFERARSYLQRSLAINRKYSAKMLLAWDLSGLGDLAYFESQFADMQAFFEESLANAEECGIRLIMVWSTHHLGVAARRLGQPQQAAKRFRGSLDLAIAYGFTDLILENLAGLAGILAEGGQASLAVRLLGMVATNGLENLSPICRSEFTRDQSEARAKLTEEDYQSAWEEGQKMGIEQARDLIQDR